MDRRLRPARTVAMALLGVALVACVPWLGAWPIVILAGLAVAWFALDARVGSSRKPEWILATGWLLSVCAIAGGVLSTGGAHSPAKAWFLVPAIALPARFTKRVVNVGVAICLLALALVTIAAEPHEVASQPQLFLFPAAVVAAAVAMSMALRAAEIEHRNQSVLDQLTGMLNRKALESRTIELELQSRVTRQPVGLIICDIDHFKQVNDRYGHSMGDAVLKDVAYRIRKELRAYDLAYRLGGEEFVVLVPGATDEEALGLAEKLREAVRAEPIAGWDVTMSFGVAVSGAGGFDLDAHYARADAALYEAKRLGRDRVVLANA